MWPYDYVNPMIPHFQGAKAAAANVPQPGEHGDYTADMFREDFPQFYNDGDPPAQPKLGGRFLSLHFQGHIAGQADTATEQRIGKHEK